MTSLTAPTTGVFFGGWIIDRQGGYKDETGKAAMDTLRTCSYFGVGAVVFSCLTAGLDEGRLPFSLPILVYTENPY